MWLRHLVYQLQNKSSEDQTFIVTHSSRHFLISSPALAVPSANHLVAGMREVSSDEVSNWRSRLSSMPFIRGATRNGGSKSKSSSRPSPGFLASIEWPDMSVLREYLSEGARKRRRLDSEMGDQLVVDAVIESQFDNILEDCISTTEDFHLY